MDHLAHEGEGPNLFTKTKKKKKKEKVQIIEKEKGEDGQGLSRK